MPTDCPPFARFTRLVTVAIAALVLAACPKNAATPAPAGDLDLSGAAQQIAKDLSQQLTARSEGRVLVIDPILDKATGQQTGASARVETALGPALTSAIRGL